MSEGNERFQSAEPIISCVSERTEWGNPITALWLKEFWWIIIGTVGAGMHLGSHKDISSILY